LRDIVNKIKYYYVVMLKIKKLSKG